MADRPLYVTYNGFESHRYIQDSGVPQWSVLGPLLFNLFIDDIASDVGNECWMIVDDVKIFAEIEGPTDCRKLQSNHDKIVSWCSVNWLPLNTKKCTIMPFSKESTTGIKFDYH